VAVAQKGLVAQVAQGTSCRPNLASVLAQPTEMSKAPAKYGERLVARAKNLAAGVAIPAAELDNHDGSNLTHKPEKFNRARHPTLHSPQQDGDYAASTSISISN